VKFEVITEVNFMGCNTV